MTTKGWIILGVCFVVLIFVYDFTTKTPTRTLRRVVYKEDYNTWEEYKATDGSFSAKFPVIPQFATATDTTGLATDQDVVRYDVYAAQGVDGSTFMVKKVYYPKVLDSVEQEAVFAEVEKDFLKSNQDAELIFSKATRFMDRTSHDVQIEALGYDIRSRAFFDKNVLYVLIVMDRSPDHLENDFKEFTDSFIILK